MHSFKIDLVEKHHEISSDSAGSLRVNCAGCVGKIEKALKGVAGVNAASVNFADKTAMVEGSADPSSLISAVKTPDSKPK